MITITVNGKPRSCESGPTVADVVAELTGVRVGAGGAVADGTALGMAVADNATVVPRTAWAREELADGDVVEVVSATQGG